MEAFPFFSVFPGDVFFYPPGNDHISHISTCYTGTFESMIFGTSRLVGYVSSVPWRAWRVAVKMRRIAQKDPLNQLVFRVRLLFPPLRGVEKFINISTCSKGGAYSKEWHSKKTRYKYSTHFPFSYSCCCERSKFCDVFLGGSPWILGFTKHLHFSDASLSHPSKVTVKAWRLPDR